MISAHSSTQPHVTAMADVSSASMPPDELLQRSRRLDWRFLLPQIELGRVAYLGDADEELIEALDLMSAALTVHTGPPVACGRSGAEYDLVVVKGPTVELLEHAARLMQSGGALYAESSCTNGAFRLPLFGSALTFGFGKSRTSARIAYPSAVVAAVRRLGLERVETYWHWPNFANCGEIVPLGQRAAVLHSLSRRGGRPAAWGKAALGRLLLRLGLFQHFVPCFSVVAVKSSSPTGPLR